MSEEQLKIEQLRKKYSLKNKIVIYCMVFLPFCYAIHFIASILNLQFSLPIELITVSCFGVIGGYLPVNYFQKKLYQNSESTPSPIIEGK